MPEVTIIGDVMLDRYWHATATRVNPEAPGVVCAVTSTTASLGGAGAVAHIAAGLGLTVNAGCRLGKDADGYHAHELLVQDCLSTAVNWTDARTTCKQRVITNGGLMPDRFDFEDRREHDADATVLDKLELGRVVIVSDYAKGFCSTAVMQHLKAISGDSFVVVDPARGRPISHYPAADLVKLNAFEAGALTGAGPIDAARLLADRHGVAVVVTDGAHGIYFCDGSVELFQPAVKANVCDVTGAGDTVAAALALAFLNRLSWPDTLELAAELAAKQVAQIGVQQVAAECLN